MEGDRFFKLEDASLEVGDTVVFEKVGAYTMGLAPQFIEFYPAVFAERAEGITIVRDKKTAKDYLA